MELILKNHKSDNNSEQYKDSNSKTEAQSVSLSANTKIIQNQISHFDIKNCTPRAITN